MERLNDSSKVKYFYVFEFEENFPHKEAHEWINSNFRISVYVAFAYVILIFYGKKYMKHRPKYELRPTLIVWNFALALLSTIGALRTLPELLFLLREYGFTRSVCDGGYVLDSPVCSMWSWIFTVLKIFELGDTAFIVLRKQELSFLHWFHHVTSLLSVWYSFALAFGAGRASRIHVPRMAAMLLTLIQITQFIIGFSVACHVLQVLLRQEPCHCTLFNACICLSVYIMNFILFVNFFRNVYFNASDKRRVKTQ